MKKLFFVILMVFTTAAFAQDTNQDKEDDFFKNKKPRSTTKKYSVALSNEKVIFIINHRTIHVEAHSGSELIIEAKGVRTANPRAKGLSPVYNNEIDNTGVGLSQTKKGDEISFRHAAGQRGIRYIVKIPRKNDLSIISGFSTSTVEVKGCAGEVEIDMKTGSLRLLDVQGPVVANTISGGIEAKFSALSQKGPTSLKSISGFVDVTVPKSIKASLSLKTVTGQMYVSNPDLIKRKTNKDDEEQAFVFGGIQGVDADKNGGGVSMSLESVSGDVYLREK